ncbi:MAG: hypothetical protein ACPGSC_07280 [Granulosicoccaceae bacterium]
MQGIQQKLQKLHEDGIVVFDGVLDQHQIDTLRQQLLKHLDKSGRIYNGGNTQNDVINVVEDIHWVLNKTLLSDIVRVVAGDNAVYVHHSDVLHNTFTGWHKDHLAHHESEHDLDFWGDHEGEPYQVYKFALYLQDHRHDKTALRYLRASHVRSKPYNLLERIYHYFFHETAQPAPGALVVFDQRIFHNGVTPWLPTKILFKMIKNPRLKQKLWDVERSIRGMQDRVFLQVAFGRPGEYANQHAREMVERQQRKKGAEVYVVSQSLKDCLSAGGLGLAEVQEGVGQGSKSEPREV